jgi:multidrug resistance protein, MATE family
VGTPVALVLAFWYHYDFQGLWLGLLAAQATSMVRMLLVIGRTDWATEAKRAQRLTGAGAVIETEEKSGDDEPDILIDVGVIEHPDDHC